MITCHIGGDERIVMNQKDFWVNNFVNFVANNVLMILTATVLHCRQDKLQGFDINKRETNHR